VTARDYDGILKDIFQKDRPSVWNRLTGGAAIVEQLSPEFQEMRQRRADLVVRLDDGYILNVEFQAGNDSSMPFPMGTYALMIGERYSAPVRQVLLYVGRERLQMKDALDLGAVRVQYRPVDIREFRVDDL
jgi:hypothetical protein